MTDEQDNTVHTEEIPQPTYEELQRLHSAVMAIELQLQDIGAHHPKILGMAMLSMATFMVEKIYTNSRDVESANMLLNAANEAGLQNWIDQVERQRDPPQIVTLDG